MSARTPPSVTGLRVPGGSDPWSAAGFSITHGSTDNGTIDLGNLTIVPTSGLEEAELLTNGDAPSTMRSTSHPNGIDNVDHLVIMARELDALRAEINESGWTVRRERPTAMAGIDIVQLFVIAGDVLLEMIAPASGTGTVEGVWGLAVTAHDIDSTAAWFGEQCGPVTDAVQSGRRIATLRHEALALPLPIAVMSPRRTPPL